MVFVLEEVLETRGGTRGGVTQVILLTVRILNLWFRDL